MNNAKCRNDGGGSGGNIFWGYAVMRCLVWKNTQVRARLLASSPLQINHCFRVTSKFQLINKVQSPQVLILKWRHMAWKQLMEQAFPKVWAHSQLRDPFHRNNTTQPWVHEHQTSFLYFKILLTSTPAFIWCIEKVLMNFSYEYSKCRRHTSLQELIAYTCSRDDPHPEITSSMLCTQKSQEI